MRSLGALTFTSTWERQTKWHMHRNWDILSNVFRCLYDHWIPSASLKLHTILLKQSELKKRCWNCVCVKGSLTCNRMSEKSHWVLILFRYLRVLLVFSLDRHTRQYSTLNYDIVHSSMESKEVVCECVCERHSGDKERYLMNTKSNEPFVFHSHKFFNLNISKNICEELWSETVLLLVSQSRINYQRTHKVACMLSVHGSLCLGRKGIF